MVANYCFVRNARDEDLLVLIVIRIYPWLATYCIPCDVKGSDVYAENKLSGCIRSCGVVRMAYMCDQESALNVMMQAALRLLKLDGEFAGGVPENSAVGESQSNSRAERAVLEAELRIRVLKHALQERIDRRIPSTHPVMLWMAQSAGVLLTTICST